MPGPRSARIWGWETRYDRPMNVKNGAAHLRALDKDREVYLDGELITRVAHHPAFAAACRSAAALYDFQAAAENVERMTFKTETGRRANRA